MEVALEAGANDIMLAEGLWELTCEPQDYLALRQAIESAEIPMASSEVTMVPSTQVACDAVVGEKILRMIEAFEDHDDVSKCVHECRYPRRGNGTSEANFTVCTAYLVVIWLRIAHETVAK